MVDYIIFCFDDGDELVTSLRHPTTNNVVTFTLHSMCEGDCSSDHCNHCAGWQVDGLPEIYQQTDHRDEIYAGYAREYYDLPIRPQFEVCELIETLVENGYVLLDE